ncbi:MAG: primosomal protein N' [Isosphaeraceae bacterium]|jgi:primosomal protein N' (replication factor Y)|nr:MAG: primosomal protein N' [Isosphaeraceae bacterium]
MDHHPQDPGPKRGATRSRRRPPADPSPDPNPNAGHPQDVGYAEIVFNRPLDTALTYRLPPGLARRVAPGARVRVPLGRANTPTVGYCVGRLDHPPAGLDPSRLKDALELLDDPPLIDGPMLELTRWMASYYACSWGQALDAVVPAGVKKAAGTVPRTILVVPDSVRWASSLPDLPPKQAEVLQLLLRTEGPMTTADICRLARCGTGPIAALRRLGLVHAERRRLDRATSSEPAEPAEPDPTPSPPTWTDEQRHVLARLEPALAGDQFAAFLLHGVTGSGKTEVYLSAIERVVARGREAIVLVPEISLTPQTIRRFRRRFPRVAVLHSHLTDAERHRHWRAIAAGEVEVVVGARSAIFAPTRRLGLIVVDEEHETTFKQETVPRYHARDLAVKRAQLLGIPVILGSATPSLESWLNAERGRYQRLTLERRVGDRPMPEVAVVDLRFEKPDRGQSAGSLSRVLIEAIGQALDQGGQVMLLLNRRGYHTFILCPRCGQVCKCRSCDVALTYHQARQVALCHTCDAETPPPESCPACGSSRLHYGGVGTERLERDVRSAFPDRIVRRMDSDTMRAPGSHERVLEAFRAGKVEILLGTQMIAKGLDFPDVTLVGVVNADTALHLPDFRAAERTFQLLAQVAGRTGRGDRPGRVLIQTYNPEAPAIAYAVRHDYLGFVASELPQRAARGVPPYGRLVRLIARGPDESSVRHFLDELAERLRAGAGRQVEVLGPAPAPVARIRDLYRYHLQLRAAAHGPLKHLLTTTLPACPPPSTVELAIDVDPVSLL